MTIFAFLVLAGGVVGLAIRLDTVSRQLIEKDAELQDKQLEIDRYARKYESALRENRALENTMLRRSA